LSLVSIVCSSMLLKILTLQLPNEIMFECIRKYQSKLNNNNYYAQFSKYVNNLYLQEKSCMNEMYYNPKYSYNLTSLQELFAKALQLYHTFII
jgi:hypothetical protein